MSVSSFSVCCWFFSLKVTATPVEFPGTEIDKMTNSSSKITGSTGECFQLDGGNAIDRAEMVGIRSSLLGRRVWVV